MTCYETETCESGIFASFPIDGTSGASSLGVPNKFKNGHNKMIVLLTHGCSHFAQPHVSLIKIKWYFIKFWPQIMTSK